MGPPCGMNHRTEPSARVGGLVGTYLAGAAKREARRGARSASHEPAQPHRAAVAPRELRQRRPGSQGASGAPMSAERDGRSEERRAAARIEAEPAPRLPGTAVSLLSPP